MVEVETDQADQTSLKSLIDRRELDLHILNAQPVKT